jgi:hypothetical protein
VKAQKNGMDKDGLALASRHLSRAAFFLREERARLKKNVRCIILSKRSGENKN